jgi:hypothetical protein
MEAEKVKPLASFPQVHDPRLSVLELKPELAEDDLKRLQGALGFPLCAAHHEQIICVADQDSRATICPLPIEPVQVDVA